MKTRKNQNLTRIILTAVMVAGIVASLSIMPHSITVQITLDNTIDNWRTTSHYKNAFNVPGGVSLTSNKRILGSRANYTSEIDVSEQVTFDIQFTVGSLSNGFLAIIFGNCEDAYINPGAGLTYHFYRISDNAVKCPDGPESGVIAYPFYEINSFKLLKGRQSWDLYLKNSMITEYRLVGSIPFTSVEESVFFDFKARLGFMIYDGLDQELTFQFTNLTHKSNSVINFGTYKISSTNIISGIPENISRSVFLQQIQTGVGASAKLRYSDGSEISSTTEIGTGMILQVVFASSTTNYTFLLKGDANGNGEVDIADVALVRMDLLQSFKLSSIYKLAGDIDNNYFITISDLLALKKHIIGISAIKQ